MSRVNSQPENAVSTTDVNSKVSRGIERAKAWKEQGIAFAKKRPAMAIALGVLTLAGLGYVSFSGDGSVPVAEAGLPAHQQKTQKTGQIVTQEIVVGSGKILAGGSLLVLNNHTDYRQATMSVLVDLKACPEMATVSVRSLRGQTVRAKGELQHYQGKPQILVTNSKNLTVDPAAIQNPPK